MKKIIFKLFEFSSSVFTKSYQLKDINIVSLTEGFELNINIFDSLLKSIKINYSGNASTIKICLRKKKLIIGIGQMNIIKKKQAIHIYPTNNNPDKKIITLIVLCYYKKEFTENFESYRSPEKVSFNLNNSNNINSFSTLSLFLNKNKTPANKRQKNLLKQKNKSQVHINNGSNKKKLLAGLTQNSICSANSNMYQYDKDKDYNITNYTEKKNTKSILSGSISQYSKNFFSEKKEINKKKYSPDIYSYPYNSKNIINNREIKTEKKKMKFQNKSMINNLFIPNFDLKLDAEMNDLKISQNINLDKMNQKIEEYIIDKSFEDVLQKDVPIISQEDKQFFYIDDLNSNKFKKIIKDLFLIYNNNNENIVNDKDIKYETHFLITKIYELMNEYYKEYYIFDNQTKSLINIIKNYGNRYNYLQKQKTKLKIIIYKNKIKKDIFFKVNDLNIFNTKHFNNELTILKSINQIDINNNYINISNNKKNKLRDILLIIIKKNKNKVSFKNDSNKKLVNKNNNNHKKNTRRINSVGLIAKKCMNTNLSKKGKPKYTFSKIIK